jgi:superfamily I DNA/RNA helicase
LTYSTRARQDLLKRLQGINRSSGKLTIKTIHGFCWEIMKDNLDILERQDIEVITNKARDLLIEECILVCEPKYAGDSKEKREELA